MFLCTTKPITQKVPLLHVLLGFANTISSVFSNGSFPNITHIISSVLPRLSSMGTEPGA